MKISIDANVITMGMGIDDGIQCELMLCAIGKYLFGRRPIHSRHMFFFVFNEPDQIVLCGRNHMDGELCTLALKGGGGRGDGMRHAITEMMEVGYIKKSTEL